MREAVRMARDAAAEGDIVLLSPMCSSFDMFSSYKERGEVFRKAVLALQSPEASRI
jgi:UDP-N-acetylmuramoylalanine--D-glutamate ligase